MGAVGLHASCSDDAVGVERVPHWDLLGCVGLHASCPDEAAGMKGDLH